MKREESDQCHLVCEKERQPLCRSSLSSVHHQSGRIAAEKVLLNQPDRRMSLLHKPS